MAVMIDRPLLWLYGEVKTPPFSAEARLAAGVALRRLQRGETLAMPESRPMPSVGKRCHELRIDDGPMRRTWRIIYRVDSDAIVILEVFAKTTQRTPPNVIDTCRRRLKLLDGIGKE